jgi:hypothetical protein
MKIFLKKIENVLAEPKTSLSLYCGCEINTQTQMDDLDHHLKNASREDFLRLRESGLNSFLNRKNLIKGGFCPLFLFSHYLLK